MDRKTRAFGLPSNMGSETATCVTSTYEGQFEGRMAPVRSGQSAFVGDIALNVNHENSGSDPISVLHEASYRGRFQGDCAVRSRSFLRKEPYDSFARLSLPASSQFRSSIFHDAGQIFPIVRASLPGSTGTVTTGVSLAFTPTYRTVLRIEYGYSSEGSIDPSIHSAIAHLNRWEARLLRNLQ